MKKSGLLIILCFHLAVTYAQSDTAEVKTFLHKMQRAYATSPYLGFTMKYLYANKGMPDKYTDSLSGSMQMDKNRYRLFIDGVETIVTDRYSIRLMKEEKLIYLSKASHAGLMDPVSLVDSMLTKTAGMQASIFRKDGKSTLHFVFPPGQPYSKLSVIMDDKTGFISKVSYQLFTAGLVGQDMIEAPGHPGAYQAEGKIDIVFSEYRRGSFDDSLFNEEIYFTRQGAGQFEPSQQYKDYRIFLASSNL